MVRLLALPLKGNTDLLVQSVHHSVINTHDAGFTVSWGTRAFCAEKRSLKEQEQVKPCITTVSDNI